MTGRTPSTVRHRFPGASDYGGKRRNSDSIPNSHNAKDGKTSKGLGSIIFASPTSASNICIRSEISSHFKDTGRLCCTLCACTDVETKVIEHQTALIWQNSKSLFRNGNRSPHACPQTVPQMLAPLARGALDAITKTSGAGGRR